MIRRLLRPLSLWILVIAGVAVWLYTLEWEPEDFGSSVATSEECAEISGSTWSTAGSASLTPDGPVPFEDGFGRCTFVTADAERSIVLAVVWVVLASGATVAVRRAQARGVNERERSRQMSAPEPHVLRFPGTAANGFAMALFGLVFTSGTASVEKSSTRVVVAAGAIAAVLLSVRFFKIKMKAGIDGVLLQSEFRSRRLQWPEIQSAETIVEADPARSVLKLQLVDGSELAVNAGNPVDSDGAGEMAHYINQWIEDADGP